MRKFGFLFGLALLGSGAPAHAGPVETFHVDRIEDNHVLTRENAVIAFHGVRMIEEEAGPELYRKAMSFLSDAFGRRPFRLDDTLFRESGAEINRYGDRQGMILLADGRWLQEELILRGYGFWDGTADYPAALRERLIRAESAAAVEKSGLWRKFSIIDGNNPPKEYWDGQFAIARGTVRDVYKSPTVTYLNFGDDWRTDFTAAISSRARKNFEAAGWKLADLKNRSVTVRGVVRFYNGPYMELDFPEQLELEEVTGEG